MPDKLHHTIPSLPVSNYSLAVARAVEWLGDRYLLAKPVNTSLPERQSPAINRHRKDVS
jgi:hypothetical protein